jgi:chromosome partitioning protein
VRPPSGAVTLFSRHPHLIRLCVAPSDAAPLNAAETIAMKERAWATAASTCVHVDKPPSWRDDMKTIAIISQKGGAGKTTLAVHLAVCAQLHGYRSAVVDLDPQATARKWGDKRRVEPEVVGDHAERLSFLTAAARENGADILVIDTAPNADRASLMAARAADLILIPCRPAAFDLDAIEATWDLAALARKPAWVLFSSAPVRSALVEEARRGLEEQGRLVVPQTLHQRVAFSHSVIDGRTAMEFEPTGKAAGEMREVYAWACSQLDMPARPRVGRQKLRKSA